VADFTFILSPIWHGGRFDCKSSGGSGTGLFRVRSPYYLFAWTGFLYDRIILSTVRLVRDSSAVRRLFVRLAGAVGRQSALHKENSGFATPTVGWHISMFPGYRILFSIWNPYINRFTNHFSIHSQPSYPQKVVLHSITARFCLRPYHFAIWRSFSNLQTWSRDTNWMMTATRCMMGSLRT
jgi:hypothetical protein